MNDSDDLLTTTEVARILRAPASTVRPPPDRAA